MTMAARATLNRGEWPVMWREEATIALVRATNNRCPACGRDARPHKGWLRCFDAGRKRQAGGIFEPVEFQVRGETIVYRHWQGGDDRA